MNKRIVVIMCLALIFIICLANICLRETKGNLNENYSSSIYQNNTNIKENDDIDTSEIEYDNPKIEMTKEQVLKTSWGKPISIDHGGTAASKNNKKRTNGEWDESWYYKRNKNIIFVNFKHGKVVKFIVSFNGEMRSKEISGVEGL